MEWMVTDGMPHIRVDIHGGVYRDGVRTAYTDLSAVHNNTGSFSKILDNIGGGEYSLAEAMVAETILAEALHGYFMHGDQWIKGRYIRINGCELLLLLPDHEVLSGEEMRGWEFYGDNGMWLKLGVKEPGRKEEDGKEKTEKRD